MTTDNEHITAIRQGVEEAHDLTFEADTIGIRRALSGTLNVHLPALSEELTDLRETVEDMARQFGYETVKDGVPCLTTGGLSALEGAFAVLGWDDPHPCPEQKCAVDGCSEWATSGTPTPDGYKRLCGTHYREQNP